MADLLSVLSRASSSLSAHRAASATAAGNLENVDTPGYARQRVELGTLATGVLDGRAFLGGGATVLGITQARDRFLEAQIPGATAAAARTAAEASALEGFTALDNDAPGNLPDALAGFYAGLRELSQNPADPTLRQAAIQGATTLVQSLRATAASVATARAALDERAEGTLAEVNSLARQMADLNGAIRAARASGAEPNDLLDARLRVRDRLAELTGATPIPDASGDVGMALPGGVSLVSGDRAAVLSAEPDPGNGGLLRFRLVRPDGSGPVALAAQSLGGTLGGILDARDGALATVARGLDDLAFGLGQAVNEVHRQGVGLDGTGGRDLFTLPDGPEGAALALAVDPEVLADPGKLAAASAEEGRGGATNLFALLATETQPLDGGLDVVGGLASLVAGFGAATSRARAAADQHGALRDNLQAMREATSGVSIDEELVEMTKAQRAYDAVSKVIATVDEMLETLLNLR